MRTPRRLIVSKAFLRPSIAFVLYLCAWATFPPAYAGQTAPSDPQSFSAMTRRAIARGGQPRPNRSRNNAPRVTPPPRRCSDSSPSCGAVHRGDGDPRAGRPARPGRRSGAPARPAASAARTGAGRHPAAQPGARPRIERAGRRRAVPRGARRPCAQPAARCQHALSRGKRRLRRPRDRCRLGPAVSREIQQARGPSLAAGRHQDRAGVGAGARRPGSRAGGRESRRPPPPRPGVRSRSTSSSPTPISCSRSSISTTPSTTTPRAKIQTVLEINPSHLDARSLLAAIAYVRDDPAAFDAEVKRVLAVNPAYGDVYRVAADLAARNYRFDEAVALTREAVALDPANTRAYGDLGMQLMRTGDEVEARARSSDPSTPTPSTRSPTTCCLARHARQVRRRTERRSHLQVRSRTRRRSCGSTRSRSRTTR